MKLHATLHVLTALLLLTIYLLSTGNAAADAQKALHVSPSGSDDNSGSEQKPFKTIRRARDEVRKANQKMTGDIEVILHGGTFRLSETLVFDHRDGGTDGHHVVYKAAKDASPVLSGGRAITGWKEDAEGRWKASTDIDNFRQLYVNGNRAVRARSPEAKAKSTKWFDLGIATVPGMKLFGENGYRTTDTAMADWRNPGDIELCYYVGWCHTRCKVQSIARDGPHAVIRMLQPYFKIARTKQGVQVNLPNYIENAFELLDEPGEWYLDRAADTVYYMPKPGEDMKTARVIAPTVEKLVELRGTLEQPVENMRFEGLTFAHAGRLQPSRTGLVDMQATFTYALERLYTCVKPWVTQIMGEAVKTPANIVCRAAKGVRFERCTFTKLGGAGIDLEHGSANNTICGCRFHDISGTAIQVGDVLKDDHHPSFKTMIVKNNAVINNLIHDCCVEYYGGVGVFAGYTDGTIIANNEIRDLPYSAISVGWGWGIPDTGGGAQRYYSPYKFATPTPSGNNRIERNHIHHVQRKLSDGGGIYTLGNMPGTIIRGNHIHDNGGHPGAIYLDEGSGFIEVTGNVVYNVSKPMNYNNRAQNRNATCNEHGNFFGNEYAKGAKKLPEGAKKVIGEAGLQPKYRDLLQKGRK
ncbi:MAG: right-handed parallel beta-helix repeat-containing protein [Planctomycetota bacterium]|nr:right-handed parallel beta-helix repeat-containing protein [Planctomycetota bacterium]